MAAGKSFAEAQTAAEVKATSYTYSQGKPAKDAPAFMPALQSAVANIDAGSLAANPVEAGDDLAIVYLEKLELPSDPKMPEDKNLLKRQNGYADASFTPSTLFSTWFAQQRDAIAPRFRSRTIKIHSSLV